MKVMIVQPMAGKTDEEICEERCNAVERLDSLGYEVANSLFDFDNSLLDGLGIKHVPLFYLAKSLEVMSKCDAVYYCDGWEAGRGCQIEYATAAAYGLHTICLPECAPKEDER